MALTASGTSRVGGLAILLSVFALPWPHSASTRDEMQESCRNFVEQFYNLYNPIDPEQPSDPTLLAGGVGERPSHANPMDPDLTKQFQELFAAEAKSGRILLDFDPVINGRRASDRYVAGRVTRKGEHYLVEVYGVSDGRQHEGADVIAELVFQVGKWTFVNFHYPNREDSRDGENLLSLLKSLRKSLREKPNSSGDLR